MAKYKDAIHSIACNDDTEFLKNSDPISSVTVDFVCNIFGKDESTVLKDLRVAVCKVNRRR